MRRVPVLLLLLLAAPLGAQDVSVEYQVKAAYLFNFVKFVEWPTRPAIAPIAICVAGRNPFGQVLSDTVRGETVNGRPLAARIILEPESDCDVLFVPRGSPAMAYLRAVSGLPTLTVGEEEDFIGLGGIISLRLEGTNVRFTINPDAAERSKLRISSRLLRLARIAGDRGERP
jgi:hypothetical protein